jgi:uncharacterized RDD family membrane protein YckC
MTEVVTGEAVVLDVPCARFPSRMLAIIIDMAAQVTTFGLIIGIILGTGSHLNAASLAAVLVATLVLVIVGYPTAFETLGRGRSLGKLALGLRVVSDDGGPERFRQALVRALASIVEIWSFTGAPALICSLLSAKGKRLGDLFAGTFVIQERLPRRPALPAVLAVVPPPLAGWAQALELSGLNDQTAQQAASYLRRFYELTPAARDEFGQRIAAAVAAQVTPPPPPGTPPAAFLSAVLAVRRQREMARLAAMQAGPAGQQPAWPATGQQPAWPVGPTWPNGPAAPVGPAWPGAPGAPGSPSWPSAPGSPGWPTSMVPASLDASAPTIPASPDASAPTIPVRADTPGAAEPASPDVPEPTPPARQEHHGSGGFAPPV